MHGTTTLNGEKKKQEENIFFFCFISCKADFIFMKETLRRGRRRGRGEEEMDKEANSRRFFSFVFQILMVNSERAITATTTTMAVCSYIDQIDP